jgi:hypothetical protein
MWIYRNYLDLMYKPGLILRLISPLILILFQILCWASYQNGTVFASERGQSQADYVKIYPLNTGQPVKNLEINGQVKLDGDNSFIRVVLIDRNDQEYLVYDNNSALSDKSELPVIHACEETCILPDISADHLRIEGNSATIVISEVFTQTQYAGKNLKIPKTELIKESFIIKQAKDREKLDKLKQNISKKDLHWTAGETAISQKTYAEKKRMFNLKPADHLPNLQGLEYYRGGVFSFGVSARSRYIIHAVNPFSGLKTVFDSIFKPLKVNGQAVNLPAQWDYRSYQGQNWNTPIRDQGNCGSCWAFATAGTIEGLTNLKYNQHLNPDLSEQDILSCSGAGTCSGGSPYNAIRYSNTTGIADENCFAYKAGDLSCSTKCSDWQNRTIKTGGVQYFYSTMADYETIVKTNLINNGMVTAGIDDMNHAMVLIGWQTEPIDKTPIWIFKNSWGSNYGENGYLRIAAPPEWLSYIYVIKPPITITNNPEVQTVCTDNDGDGYCFWGLGPKIASCPAWCNAVADCNDSNANALGFDANRNCTYIITPTPETVPPTAPTNLRATVYASSLPYLIELIWSKSTDNTGVTGYGIYRDGVNIAVTAQSYFDDINIPDYSKVYTYTVRAFDLAGNLSASSNSVTASINTIPSPTMIITPSPTPNPADGNSDGKVDAADYRIWFNHYGDNIHQPAYGDFYEDAVVNGLDYHLWLNNYGK